MRAVIAASSRNRVVYCAGFLLVVAAFSACTLQGSFRVGTPTPVYTVTLAIENAEGEWQELTVEIADSPQERATGLMNVAYLDEDYGMLFVYPEDTASGFWMKDTIIPLSIAFIAADGSILE